MRKCCTVVGGGWVRMRGGGFVSAIKRVFGMKRFGEDTLAGGDMYYSDELTGLEDISYFRNTQTHPVRLVFTEHYKYC